LTTELLKISDAELVKSMSPEEKDRRTHLLNELKKFPKPPALPVAMAVQNSNGVPGRSFVLGRGDYNDPREEVQPGFPEILSPSTNDLTRVETGQGHRAALANWIASKENPLTARVMINRIWQHHFGRAIAPMPSEFGTRAEPPTHPELLEWLAGEFMARGWSIKQMHKLILLSATYQQSSSASEETRTRDPENKWFSRQNRVRLEGEIIRDSLLAISGKLNPKMGGPGVFPPIPADIAKTSKNWTASANPEDHMRRSVYIFARRNLRFPFLEAFDAPDSNLSCPERGRSTTAPQSLTLLNSEEVMSAARTTAARVMMEAGLPEERVNRAFRLVVGRKPSDEERRLTEEFLKGCDREREQSGKQDQALEELCRALFNLNAFVYVE
jgi:hypothetical protein